MKLYIQATSPRHRKLIMLGLMNMDCYIHGDKQRCFESFDKAYIYKDHPVVLVDIKNRELACMSSTANAKNSGYEESSLDNIVKLLSQPKLDFPPAAKYRLVYSKAGETAKEYTVSNPIEESEDKIIVYSFGRGVRTFLKQDILSFNKLA